MDPASVPAGSLAVPLLEMPAAAAVPGGPAGAGAAAGAPAPEPPAPAADPPQGAHHKLVPRHLGFDTDDDDGDPPAPGLPPGLSAPRPPPAPAPAPLGPELALQLVPGQATVAALTGEPLRFAPCSGCGRDHMLAFSLAPGGGDRPIERLNRHHTFRKNLRVLLAGVPWLREQRGVLDVTDAKCAARAQACLVSRVPGYRERGLALDRNDFIPRCLAWRLSLGLGQVPRVHRDPHSRSIFYPYFRIYNSQTYAPTPELATLLNCEVPSLKASGGRKKFRTMDIRDWEPNDPSSKNACDAWLPFTVPPELFNALIDCKEAIDNRRTAAETLLGAFLGPDRPPSDDTGGKVAPACELRDSATSTRKRKQGQDAFNALSEVLFGKSADRLVEDEARKPRGGEAEAADGAAAEAAGAGAGAGAPRLDPTPHLAPAELAFLDEGPAPDGPDGPGGEDDAVAEMDMWLPSPSTYWRPPTFAGGDGREGGRGRGGEDAGAGGAEGGGGAGRAEDGEAWEAEPALARTPPPRAGRSSRGDGARAGARSRDVRVTANALPDFDGAAALAGLSGIDALAAITGLE